MKHLSIIVCFGVLLVLFEAAAQTPPASINSVSQFKDNILLIYSTHEKTKELNKTVHSFCKKIQKHIFKESKLISDDKALAMNVSDYNLIVYGTPNGNSFINKYKSVLPVTIDSNQISAIKTYEGENTGIVLAWNNPVNSSRNMLIYSSLNAENIHQMNYVYHGPTQYVISSEYKELESGYFWTDTITKKWKCSKLPLLMDSLFTPEQIAEDIDYMINTMESVHPNLYDYVDQTNFKSSKDSIISSINTPITRIDLFLKTSPLISSLKDGHTRIYFPSEECTYYLEEEQNFIPFLIKIINDKIYMDTCIQCGSVQGNEITSINGVDCSQMLQDFRNMTSGEKTSFKDRLIENNFQKYYRLLNGPYDSFEIEYYPKDGKTRTSILKTIRYDEYKKMRNARNHFEQYYTYKKLNQHTGLIEFNSFQNAEEFKTFLKETFTKIKTDSIQNLIIDIRKNGGGNSYLGDLLISYIWTKPYRMFAKVDIKQSEHNQSYRSIKERIFGNNNDSIITINVDPHKPNNKKNDLIFHGNVYVLTSEYTFSSATDFAAAIKDYKMGEIIGSETGGLATCYGDILSFVMPNTKLMFGVSFKHFTRPGDFDDGKGVIPDHIVNFNSKDISKNNDKVLNFTLDLINHSQNNSL